MQLRFAHLLTATKREIQQSVAELSQGRTTRVIAHRSATIRHADRIVVVEGSGVAEQGSHETLIAFGGTYSRLHAAVRAVRSARVPAPPDCLGGSAHAFSIPLTIR